MDKGFMKVRPLAGGLDGWADAGHPLEGEEQPLYAIRPAADMGGADHPPSLERPAEDSRRDS